MIKTLSLVFCLVTLIVLGISVPTHVGALDDCYKKDADGNIERDGSGNPKTLDNQLCKTNAVDLTQGIIKQVINILLTVAGIIAVLMVVIGGIRYVTSDGDSSRASQAKNTILYALIGLIVAVSSYAIVNFVLGRI